MFSNLLKLLVVGGFFSIFNINMIFMTNSVIVDLIIKCQTANVCEGPLNFYFNKIMCTSFVNADRVKI